MRVTEWEFIREMEGYKIFELVGLFGGPHIVLTRQLS